VVSIGRRQRKKQVLSGSLEAVREGEDIMHRVLIGFKRLAILCCVHRKTAMILVLALFACSTVCVVRICIRLGYDRPSCVSSY
jgi:hypothetical protein